MKAGNACIMSEYCGVSDVLMPSHATIMMSSSESPHAVTWDEPQLRPVLEEHVAGTLGRIDSDAVVGDDGRRLRGHLELRWVSNSGL